MQYLFYALALLSIISAVTVVAARSPVNSVIALVVCFLSIAGHYILLNAQFLAMVHVIVYTGAIMVLFLFVIMLLNLNKASELSRPATARIAAVMAGGLLFLTLLAAVRDGVAIASAAETFDPGVGLVRSVGLSLFRTYLVPFEVSSVLFLSATVGALMLAKRDTAAPGPEPYMGNDLDGARPPIKRDQRNDA